MEPPPISDSDCCQAKQTFPHLLCELYVGTQISFSGPVRERKRKTGRAVEHLLRVPAPAALDLFRCGLRGDGRAQRCFRGGRGEGPRECGFRSVANVDAQKINALATSIEAEWVMAALHGLDGAASALARVGAPAVAARVRRQRRLVMLMPRTARSR